MVDRTSQIKRMIPYLQAAIGNIADVNNSLRSRNHRIESAGFMTSADLDALQGLKDEMMEELIELDGVLDKAEKLIRPKES